MARTRDEAAHAHKRDLFLHAAQQLLQSKGYEAMTISDVIAATKASKGAFYHYFESKQDLLTSLLSRMGDQIIAATTPVMNDPALNAVQRFDGFITVLTAWKLQRRDLIAAAARAWFQDGNTTARYTMRAYSIDKIGGILTEIVRQGVREGLFAVSDAEVTGRLCMVVLLDLNDQAARWFMADALDESQIAHIKAQFTAYYRALERILGAEPDSIQLLDDAAFTIWFTPRSR